MTAITLTAQDKNIKLGVNLGLASLDSDVESADKSGLTLGVDISKNINKKWSLITSYNYIGTRGLDYIPTYEYAGYSGQYQPSYQNQSHSLDFSINRNIHIEKSRLYFGLKAGIGITASKTMMDILNADQITYAKEANDLPYRLAGCPEVICGVSSIDYEYITYDRTFETPAMTQPSGTSMGNHQLFISVPLQISMMLMVTERLDLGLSINTRITTNDYIDGIGNFTLYNGEIRETSNTDLYQSYRLLAYYRIGKKEENLTY